MNSRAPTKADYELLGVSEEATRAEVKSTFHRRALTGHPDKGGDPEEFKKIVDAYEKILAAAPAAPLPPKPTQANMSAQQDQDFFNFFNPTPEEVNTRRQAAETAEEAKRQAEEAVEEAKREAEEARREEEKARTQAEQARELAKEATEAANARRWVNGVSATLEELQIIMAETTIFTPETNNNFDGWINKLIEQRNGCYQFFNKQESQGWRQSIDSELTMISDNLNKKYESAVSKNSHEGFLQAYVLCDRMIYLHEQWKKGDIISLELKKENINKHLIFEKIKQDIIRISSYEKGWDTSHFSPSIMIDNKSIKVPTIIANIWTLIQVAENDHSKKFTTLEEIQKLGKEASSQKGASRNKHPFKTHSDVFFENFLPGREYAADKDMKSVRPEQLNRRGRL